MKEEPAPKRLEHDPMGVTDLFKRKWGRDE